MLTRRSGIGDDDEAGPGEARCSARVLEGERGKVRERYAQGPVGEVARDVFSGPPEGVGLAGERQLVEEGAPAARAGGRTS